MGNFSRAARSGRQPSLLAANLDLGSLDELETVLSEAGALLGPNSIPPLDEITDFDAAAAALAGSWQSIRTAFADGRARAERVDCSTIDDLMHRMVHNERIVRSAQVRHRDAAIRLARETLADLRDVESVDGLISAGAEAVCRLGFDRSVVSRVEDNTWMIEAVYFEGESEWAAETLAAGRAQGVPLNCGLPEDEARRRVKPILVTRAQERETIHKAVAESSLTRSYVAAPIMPGNRLLGFVHGDRYFHRGDVTDFDAELIGLFAQGFSFALERAIISQELEQMRSAVRKLGAGLQSFADGEEAPLLPSLGGMNAAGAAAVSSSGLAHPTFEAHVTSADLTRREYDVFQLMAQGDTNHRIARRLSISEGTVKSHVKHILRKLGAANRAEAVARWHAAKSQCVGA